MNKVAFITGGTRGIGKQIARTLAKEGCHIAINYRNQTDELASLKEEIEQHHVKCLLVQGDVSIFSDCEKMVKQIIEEFEKIDILVNNAGITKDMLLMRMKTEDFEQVIDVNLIGTFNVTRNVIPYMMKAHEGRIINISSVVGIAGNAGQTNYAASKAGIIGFTKSLAKEVGSRNILVNAIAPGFIQTDMTKVLKEEVKEEIANSIPLKRMGTTQDVANVVKFLASEDSSYITGQVIHIDGRHGHVKGGSKMKMEKRVVITGLGAITPIGNTVAETWDGIKSKKCGVDAITLFDASDYKTSLDAEVKNYQPLDYFDAKQTKRLDRSSQFAIIAAKEAFADSKITSENTNFERVGVFVSSGIAGLTTTQEQCGICSTKGHGRVSPMFIPMGIANMPAGNVSIELGLKGESISIVTACASSTHAIGEAYKTIQYGAEDVILAGGTEAAICEVGLAGFENMKALSYATDKNRASIPFDKDRSGFVMGEGAGILVLEELEHAQKRGAKIYAEVIGYGATSDAYHITSPAPGGEGGARAMKRAMENANIQPEEIDYINAHGTSTHLNDSLETMAIKTALGEASKKVMVSSTKGNTGHLLGGAGAVEAIICTKSIEDGIVPPTIHYQNKDEECDLDIVPNEPRKANLNIVMSNSLGFGGQNATIILKKYQE